ncbi:phosphate binding protein [Dehalogenimonas lykanthroporepellens BL-DC-9]|nr:phosphate binding protein [Dehalogenimonas lykanthroporepellens BL-DC-9]
MKSKRFLKWFTLPLALVLSLSLVVTGCTDGDDPDPTSTGETLSGFIDVTGSNTVTPVSSAWAEEFMDQHPAVSIAVSGPGSGAGIAAFINKTTDIAQSSRPMKDSEKQQATAAGVTVVETRVALDALSVVVNPNNPVSELTIQQLSDIYSGKITNWSQLGGNNAPIVALSRDTNSGTYAYFLEEVVQLKLTGNSDKSIQYAPAIQLLPSTEVGITQVAQNANAIFYAGMGYVDNSVKAIAVKKTADDPAVSPALATAKDGSYAIARYLYFYTDGQPTGIIKAFIDFALSPAGQAIVEEMGFVAIS